MHVRNVLVGDRGEAFLFRGCSSQQCFRKPTEEIGNIHKPLKLAEQDAAALWPSRVLQVPSRETHSRSLVHTHWRV